MPINLEFLPHSAGVYLMRDGTAKIIYIGKAKDLRKRVASYFQNLITHPKIANLVLAVRHIDYIAAASERDALIIEQRLIRRVQPLYNTMWRDDKSYPYIKLTSEEDYPRLLLTRRKKKDGGTYFGPYPQVHIVRKLIRNFWRNKTFPLRPCRYQFSENDVQQGLEKSQPALAKKVKSCLYLHTQECPAPCINKISKTQYGEMVRAVKLYFSGKSLSLKKRLNTEMQSAAENLNFEKAAQIRDQIKALTHIAEKVTLREIDEKNVLEQTQTTRALTEIKSQLNLPRPPMVIEAFDISNIQGTDAVASMVQFQAGKPQKSGYRKFKIKSVEGPNDFAMMAEVITRRYKKLSEKKEKFPDLILVDGGKGQLSSAMEAVQNLRKSGYAMPALFLAGLAKENEEIYLPNRAQPIVLPKDSSALHVLQHIRDEAHRFAITFHRDRRKKRMFSL